MADEKIVYPIGTSGGEAAAAAFDKIATAQERTVKLQDAINAARAKSGDVSRLVAYREEADRVNEVQDKSTVALARATQAANDNARGLAALGENSTQLRSKLGAGAGALTQLAGAFSAVVPAAAEFEGAIGVGLRSMGGFLGVIGGGPGIVLGGVVAAIGILGSVMSSASKEADELAKKTLEGARAFKTYAQEIQDLRNTAAEKMAGSAAERTLQQRLRSGQGSSDEYARERAALQELIKEKGTVQKSLDAALASGDHDLLVKFAELKQRILEAPKLLTDYRHFQEAARKTEADARDNAGKLRGLGYDQEVADADADANKKKDGGKGRSFDSAAAEQKNQDIIAKIDAIQRKARMDARAEEWTQQDETFKRDLASTQESEKAKRDEDWKTYDAQKKLAEDEYNTQTALDKQAFAQRVSNQMRYGALVANATSQLIQQAVSGRKIELASILGSLGNQMIAQGTMAGFSGAIKLYNLNPAGAGEIATGAAEVAAGVVLAGGAAIANHGGVGAPASIGLGPTSASPLRDNSGGSGGDVTNITYVEFNSPYAPSAETGMRIRRDLNAANNTYGPQR